MEKSDQHGEANRVYIRASKRDVADELSEEAIGDFLRRRVFIERIGQVNESGGKRNS